MIVHSTTPRPGAASSAPSESTDCEQDRDTAARPDGDPFRQLFGRHANHLNGALARGIQARLRHRLFASDNELG